MRLSVLHVFGIMIQLLDCETTFPLPFIYIPLFTYKILLIFSHGLSEVFVSSYSGTYCLTKEIAKENIFVKSTKTHNRNQTLHKK